MNKNLLSLLFQRNYLNSHALACVYVFRFAGNEILFASWFLFIMFKQAVSSSLHELGLVSLRKEQRQAMEAIVMKGRDVLSYRQVSEISYLLSFAGYIRLHG